MRALLFIVGAIAVAAAGAAAIGPKSGDGVHLFQRNSDGGSGNIVIRDDDRALNASWRGDLEIAADGKRLTRLDGRLEIERAAGKLRRRVVYSGGGATIDARFFENDRELPFDAATEEKAGALLLEFVRMSGFGADARVAAMLEAGGTPAVIAEIGEIEGSHGAMRYMAALAEQASLSDDDVVNLAARIKRWDGDHAKRRAISSLIEHQPPSDRARDALLDAASGVSSDHDLRLIVQSIASGPLTPSAVASAAKLIETIESDHDFRLAASMLLDNPSLTDESAGLLLARAAASVEGDHDLRLIINAGATRAATSDAAAAAAIDAAETIGSDHDRRLALMAIADALPESSSRWGG